jgi:hypothetical protein
MKRPAQLYSLITATVVALAAPATFAADIMKCVDPAGHVTLTDQPCEAGAASIRVERGLSQAPASMSAATVPAEAPQRAGTRERYVLPVVDPVAFKRPDLKRAAPLDRDVATLREARRTLLLQESRASLAGLP